MVWELIYIIPMFPTFQWDANQWHLVAAGGRWWHHDH